MCETTPPFITWVWDVQIAKAIDHTSTYFIYKSSTWLFGVPESFIIEAAPQFLEERLESASIHSLFTPYVPIGQSCFCRLSNYDLDHAHKHRRPLPVPCTFPILDSGWHTPGLVSRSQTTLPGVGLAPRDYSRPEALRLEYGPVPNGRYETTKIQ